MIRVANFPTDNCSTAGQVVDNYPEGRVKVWFVDGTMSMCWPQDLFEVHFEKQISSQITFLFFSLQS